MEITLFTSNNNRHNYLINLLSTISDKLYIVQEHKELHSGNISDQYSNSEVVKEYFKKVNDAQTKFFGNPYVDSSTQSIKLISIPAGDLYKCSLPFLADFLKSDLYIVYGSSYLKGDLVDYLIKKKTINIHMGVSPYYRGSSCNFWALYDGNPHLVGATIHMLSKGLDSGPMLYHAMSNFKSSPFDYSMSTVKSAFHSLAERINDRSIFKIKPKNQEKSLEVRYSKKVEFNEKIIQEYFKKKINLDSIKFDKSLLKDPFFLSN
jgi:hypothetical protein|tara:strand:- start:215 stop:1003 length:789 start_codon:yes stop_codon:yes gene_type:complete